MTYLMSLSVTHTGRIVGWLIDNELLRDEGESFPFLICRTISAFAEGREENNEKL
jgi:hypothetical protein